MTASGAAINISHITVVSVALLLGMVNDASAQKSPNIPVTVAFVDGTTDNIRSDGLGAYKDGVNIPFRFMVTV